MLECLHDVGVVAKQGDNVGKRLRLEMLGGDIDFLRLSHGS